MAIISFESVATAAEKLVAAGKKASVRNVIANLGGGSPNSVLKHLAEWKSGRPLLRIADTDLDDGIKRAITEQMQRVAAAAASASEERASILEDDLAVLTEAQQEAEQQIVSLTSDLTAAQVLASELNKALTDSQAEADRSRQQAAEQLAHVRANLAAERVRQEQTAAALARAEVRLEALPLLQEEVAQLRAALLAEQQTRMIAERDTAVAVARLEERERVGAGSRQVVEKQPSPKSKKAAPESPEQTRFRQAIEGSTEGSESDRRRG